jgi:hypothetical protein
MNFNFGEVLTRAWQIVWKHKVLWIFGILASCGRSGSNFNSNSSGGGDGGGFNSTTDLPPQVLQWLQTIQENLTAFIAVGVALICLIWIVTIFLSTIGKIGLIRGTAQVDRGAESLIFGQLFSESIPYFWRMFGLSLIVAIPILVVIAALFGGLIALALSASGGSDELPIGLFAMVPVIIGCFCLLIPVMFVVGMILRQSENAIVLEDMKVLPSLTRGWEVFRTNLGPIILMAIILAVIGAVVGFVVAIPIFIVVVPAGIAFALGEAQNWTPMILAGVCICLYTPVLLVLNGIVTAYTESAWTLTYMRLTKPQDNAPIVVEANA